MLIIYTRLQKIIGKIQYFKQIIEYLESINMPYIIDDTLVGNVHSGSHTIFQICEVTPDSDTNNRRVLAKGERSFDFSQKNKFSKISFLHASISINFDKNIQFSKFLDYFHQITRNNKNKRG